MPFLQLPALTAHTPVLLIRKLLSRFRNGENMISVAAINGVAQFGQFQWSKVQRQVFRVKSSTSAGNFHVSRIPERIPRRPCTGLAETVQVNGQYSNLENLPVPQLAQRLA